MVAQASRDRARRAAMTFAAVLLALLALPARVAAEREQGRTTLQKQLRLYDTQVGQFRELYRARLGRDHDPFALQFTQSQVSETFRRLALRGPQGAQQPTLLGKLDRALRSDVVSGRPFSPKLMEELLGDARARLDDPATPTDVLQSNYLALKFAGDYLRLHLEPDGNEDKPSPPQRRRLPEPAPAIQAHNKPLPPKSSEKASLVAETNIPTRYFASGEHSQIVRNSGGLFFYEPSRRAPPRTPGPFRATESALSLFLEPGERELTLALPPGWVPLQPVELDAQIHVTAGGRYLLRTKSDLARVDLPMVRQGRLNLAEHELAEYTEPVNIDPGEWPQKVRNAIFDRYPRGQVAPLEIARAVKTHLAKDYRYYRGQETEKDLMRALNKGEIQCDFAAGAMCAILRNGYGVPTRLRFGFGASKKGGKSRLTTGALPHSWVEVFDQGEWHTFEPQPEDNAPEPDQGDDDGEGGDDEDDEDEGDEGRQAKASQNPRGGGGGGKPGGKRGGQQQASQRSGGGGGEQPSESPPRQPSAVRRMLDRVKRSLQRPQQQEKAAGPEPQPKDDEDRDRREDLEVPKLVDDTSIPLDMGSLKLKATQRQNPLLERALRTLVRDAVEPIQDSENITRKLHRAQSVVASYPFPGLAKTLSSAMAVHNERYRGLLNRIEELQRGREAGDIPDAYADLVAARRAVQLYTGVADDGHSAEEARAVVAELEQAQRELDRIEHPKGRQIAAVRDLVRALPPLARRLLTNDQEYGMSRVGPNADTMKIAGDLAANRLADLRLIAALRPHADFVLASTPQPDSSRTKTWIDAQRRGKDLLPLRRLSDLPRATILQPGKSRRDNFREGTAFTRTKRKAGTEVVGKANESAQRVTVLLVDQSGSTKDLEQFIRTLVSTFAANALSDLAPNGQPRHKVLIIPYGDETYPEIPVTSVSQAVEMIHSRKRRFYARNAGTNTQQAIIAALRRIKQAQDEASEPLALANVVVVTDGYCTIDTDELKTERDKIDRKTPVQAMFVAIEGQNAALAEFAESSQSAGLSRGFYRHFSGLEIAKLEKQADHYDSAQLQAEGRTYYTERGWNDVPAGYFERLRTARAAAGRLEQEIAEDRRVATAETMLRTLRRPRHDADDRSGNETPGPWTQEVRHLLKGSLAFADRTLARRVTGDLFQHYGRLTGRQLDDLGPHARLELETLIEESTQPQRRGGP